MGMGAACCSQNGRCGSGPSEAEIGCAPPVAEDGVEVDSNPMALPAVASKSGEILRDARMNSLVAAKCKPVAKPKSGPESGNTPKMVKDEDMSSAISMDFVPGIVPAGAKGRIKSFVKDVVKGKNVNVLAPSGDLKLCVLSLNRDLDSLKLKMGSSCRRILLSDVDEVHAGAESVTDINTPLDELCVTLFLASNDAISFRMANMEERDTFVWCLTMFMEKRKS